MHIILRLAEMALIEVLNDWRPGQGQPFILHAALTRLQGGYGLKRLEIEIVES